MRKGEPMGTHQHWDDVYKKKSAEVVTWYQPHLEQSLAWIERHAPDRAARIVDAGGGASTLVDDLLARGYANLAVIDLSQEALAQSQARLGARAGEVDWVVGDVREADVEAQSVDVWHDRAVFQFLTDPAAQNAYVDAMLRSVRPGGLVIIATFEPEGPQRCSGLPTLRCSPEEISAAMGEGFALVERASEEHTTPSGATQKFSYALLRRGSQV